MSKLKKKLAGLLCAVMALCCCIGAASALDASSAYAPDAGLSCYVNAMGGIEFANEELFQGVSIATDDAGNAYATIKFGAGNGSFSIYTVKVYHFIDPTNSTPGYYDESGNVVELSELAESDGVTPGYTVSSDTRENNDGAEIHYVDSMTIPVSEDTGSYYLWVYVNSNVMGVQFCDGSGSAASNTPNAATPYKAALTINWDGTVKIDESSSQSATVNYTVTIGSTYEVSIPSTITVDPDTKTAAYQVVAEDFDLIEGAYVTVAADTSGALSNGAESVSFTNELAEGQLTTTGDALDGTVTVTGTPASSGTYTGTIDFTINYFSGN